MTRFLRWLVNADIDLYEPPRASVRGGGLALWFVLCAAFLVYAQVNAPVLICFPGALMVLLWLLWLKDYIETKRRLASHSWLDPDEKHPLTLSERVMFALLLVGIFPATMIAAFGWDEFIRLMKIVIE